MEVPTLPPSNAITFATINAAAFATVANGAPDLSSTTGAISVAAIGA